MSLRPVDYELYEEYKAENFSDEHMKKFKDWFEGGGKRKVSARLEKAMSVCRNQCNSGKSTIQIGKETGLSQSVIAAMINRYVTQISTQSANKVLNTYS